MGHRDYDKQMEMCIEEVIALRRREWEENGTCKEIKGKRWWGMKINAGRGKRGRGRKNIEIKDMQGENNNRMAKMKT